MKFFPVAIVCAGIAAATAVAQTYTVSTLLQSGVNRADLTWVSGITADRVGNLYVVEYDRHAIRKITPRGVITTFAGAGSGTADGPASEARFSAPLYSLAIAADDHGNLIVADSVNHTIRRISAEGMVTTLAGLPGVRGSDDGKGSAARFNLPSGVAADLEGNIYVADLLNHTIRKITPECVVTTVAGAAGSPGTVDGTSSNARFWSPGAVAADRQGNVYVASYDNTVRKVSVTGEVTTLVGRPGTFASLGFSMNFPTDNVMIGIAVDRAGVIYAADPGGRTVHRITPEGTVTTLAPSMGLFWPTGVAVDEAGTVYVADSGSNSRVLKAAPEMRLALVAAPQSQTAVLGGTAVFTAVVAGEPNLSYQWTKDGAPLAGATHASLVIPAASLSDAGEYACRVSDSAGRALTTEAMLTVVAGRNAGRLVNASVRANVGAGPDALVVGATIGGSGAGGMDTLPVLMRAVGPSLSRFDVRGFLSEPALTVAQAGRVLMANEGWGGDPQILARTAEVGAFPLIAANTRDSAIATALRPNSYTLEVSGKVGSSGVALCELFDAAPDTAPRLVNLSARKQLDAAGDVLIVGFVIRGDTAKTMLLRAVGPSLGTLGVSGAMVDPALQLFAGTTLIRENDDWAGDVPAATAARGVGAFALAGTLSRDAVLLTTLPPGDYTLQVRSQTNRGGVVLAEIFEVP
jgi:sugar lactone lactonase YvrE